MLDDGTELENPPHFFDLLPDAKKYARKHIKDMIKMATKADVSPVAFQKALAAISKTPTWKNCGQLSKYTDPKNWV